MDEDEDTGESFFGFTTSLPHPGAGHNGGLGLDGALEAQSEILGVIPDEDEANALNDETFGSVSLENEVDYTKQARDLSKAMEQELSLQSQSLEIKTKPLLQAESRSPASSSTAPSQRASLSLPTNVPERRLSQERLASLWGESSASPHSASDKTLMSPFDFSKSRSTIWTPVDIPSSKDVSRKTSVAHIDSPQSVQRPPLAPAGGQPGLKVLSMDQLEAQLSQPKPNLNAGSGQTSSEVASLSQSLFAVRDGVVRSTLPTLVPSQITLMHGTAEVAATSGSVNQKPSTRPFTDQERKRKYDGLMTKHDQDFVDRTLASQLPDGDPYVEDYYFKLFNANKRSENNLDIYRNNSGGGFAAISRLRRARQEFPRVARPTELLLEGALGKIMFRNAKNPRPLLHVEPGTISMDWRKSTKIPLETSQRRNKRNILSKIEKVYSLVIDHEDLERKAGQASADDVKVILEKQFHIAQSLYKELRVDPLTPPEEAGFFTQFLRFQKGKRVMRRVMYLLIKEHRASCILYLLTNLEHLDIFQENCPAEEVDLFLGSILPAFIDSILEEPLTFVLACIDSTLVGRPPQWVQAMCGNKVALHLLTVLFSRAEILKHQESTSGFEIDRWKGAFNYIFGCLHGCFDWILASAQAGGFLDTAWEFLAALAVQSDAQEKVGMFGEVRERFEQAREEEKQRGDTGGHTSLQFFANAVGIDDEY